MESKDLHVHLSTRRCSPEELPSPSKRAISKTMACFESSECGSGLTCPSPLAAAVTSQGDPMPGKGSETPKIRSQANANKLPPLHSVIRANQCRQSNSISISLPASPSGVSIGQAIKVVIGDKAESAAIDEEPNQPSDSNTSNSRPAKLGKFHSRSIPAGSSYGKAAAAGKVNGPFEDQQRMPRSYSSRDKRFDSFKTWSGKLERQLSNLRGKPQEPDVEANDSDIKEIEAVPAVERYFDALEGPELDTLRASELSALPEDEKWPFLLRFPISAFGMCLGVSSQAILWKTLATSPSVSFLHVSLTVNLVLWCISLALMGAVSLIYSLKIIFYFETVRREYYHPIRINFFFAPWIACLFLALGVPPSVAANLHAALWYVLMAPIFCLEIKIYGQWMSGGQRRLSKVANPSNHLAIVGNFVGALLGATMGLKEGPIFFFAVGLAHYIVLFVTLYQRLPTNEALPRDLHPVFFLFVAAPSVACMAWAQICGDFNYGSKMAYFIALFLYVSLAVRINFFRGFRFSLAWWAYTFPMTGASIATIKYSMDVTNVFTQILSVGLSAISTFAVTALLVTTIIHAFVLHDLFPNDVSIAITQKRSKFAKKLRLLRFVSSDMKDIEASVSRNTPQS
ncbi:S-type anion channel SLAH2-like [Phoenix dactylifera]|uniref:S-type anion channel SLAH2-like n=1 Tax=Phoenix dactylifera TaxID=42345 RepID=A0A8B7MV76_PHODC|nr:S-type anion channel SLAH2-like [Phoenix dactylifera]XP_038987107.1 S-type anion channel SLAH2-like [Phoenix dactylifera]